MEAVLSPCTSDEFKHFIEDNMIRGLRRLAGLEIVRRLIADSIDGDMVSDALQVLQASISNHQGKVVHYLNGVRGCGETISRQIK